MQKYLIHFVTLIIAVTHASLVPRFAYAQDVSLGDELFRLTASDAAPFRVFGTSVAISGNRALVGAPGAGNDGLSPGSAYLFDATTGQELWNFTSSGAKPQDQFGSSVAISGYRAIVGAYGDSTDGAGAAYLFDVVTGQQLSKLYVDDAQIGNSVALSGSVAIVGSYSDAAYLFDINTGQQLFKLTASDTVPNDYFGFSVGISGNVAIVGSLYDAAYLFDVSTGQELFKLTRPGSAEPTLGHSVFGQSVAISGDVAIVGSPVSGFGFGAAYVFDVTTGQSLAELTAPEPEAADLFGAAVAIDGYTAVVGGGFAHADGNTRSAFLFDVLTGERLSHIERSQIGVDPRGDAFGEAVDISGRTAIVGSSGDGIFAGSAYLYSTVPEPTSLVVLGFGASLLLWRKSRPTNPRSLLSSANRNDQLSHLAAHSQNGKTTSIADKSFVHVVSLLALVLMICSYSSPSRADIFEWEYIDPADPSLGRQQSATLAPDGAGVNAAPAVDLSNRNLTRAYLSAADLTGAFASNANLTNADFSQATLTDAWFGLYADENYYAAAADLTGANFAGASASNANFVYAALNNANFSEANLVNANLILASMNGANLSGADATGSSFDSATLTSASFNLANLRNADFAGAILTGADLAGTEVRGASFARIGSGAGITMAQLYSTASYQAHDLRGIDLFRNNLTGANFAGHNLAGAGFSDATLTSSDFSQANLSHSNLIGATLTNANLSQANLTGANLFQAALNGANFTGAEIRGANFTAYHSNGAIKLSLSQLYSTASYQAHDLTGIWFNENYLNGANFVGQNLTNVSFIAARLNNTDFRQALLTNSHFGQAALSQANFSGTNLANLNFSGSVLSRANLSQTNLSGSLFFRASLDNADFTGAEIRGANFYRDRDGQGNYGTGITPVQLYSTASYQAHDLSGIVFAGSNLSGVNLAGQNLTDTTFYYFFDGYYSYFSAANLTGADFNQANLTNARFGAWYGDGANLTNANLSQANLTNADFERTILTGANLSDAVIIGANFNSLSGTGLTVAQLSSTASYQLHDLSGVGLEGSNLTGVNLAGKNLFGANLGGAQLNNANLSQANLRNASLHYATLTGANLTGAEVRGVSFHRDSYIGDGTGLSLTQLYSTASYQAHDLTGIQLAGDFTGINLTGQNLTNSRLQQDGGDWTTNLTAANLSRANLTGATLRYANLSNADLTAADLSNAKLDTFLDDYLYLQPGPILTGTNFTGAIIRGASFDDFARSDHAITFAQLYSTASYQAHDLNGISLAGNSLVGVDFADQNLTGANFSGDGYYTAGSDLTNANFSRANLTNAALGFTSLADANFSAADTRGASGLEIPSSATTTNLVRPDGHIQGLGLTVGASLVLRDYDGNPAAFPATGPLPIVVDQFLTMDDTGTLLLEFDADPWGSTISFAPGIPVSLGGTLELDFAPGVDVASQSGRTIALFDWTGVTPTGSFNVTSPHVWDLSNLYSTGQVTLAVTPSLPGDFNDDGIVDVADYTVWRDGLASGDYSQDDYTLWRVNFGNTSSSGSIAAGASGIPEPRTLLLLAMALLPLAWCVRGRSMVPQVKQLMDLSIGLLHWRKK